MLSDEYILQQALERKWITQEQIDLCSTEKNKNESILDVLIEKDFLSKEQVDKLTWEELDEDDFLSSDLKLKVMSVDDLTLENEDEKEIAEKKPQTSPKIQEKKGTKPEININSISQNNLIGEGSAIPAHALIGEDSSFEEPIFGESSTFVQAATFAEEEKTKKNKENKQKKDKQDNVDNNMRKSSDPEEEILEFDNDFLESTDGSREFTISSSIEAEDVSGELESLRSDSAEFTISNVEIPASIKKQSTQSQKSKPKKEIPKTSKMAVQPAAQRIQKIKPQSSKPSSGKSMSTPFGKAAILLKMATEEQVNDALLSQVTDCKGKKIGKIMAEKGYLTNEQIKTILARQKTMTMVCPVCEKKYQIVLFQPGRSYRCKSPKCVDKPELVELKKYARKRKAMLEISRNDIDVMGLTGEIPKSILQRERKPNSAYTESQIENEEVTTSDLLKEVGIGTEEIVANIEVEEQPDSRSFTFLLILVFMGGFLFLAYQTDFLALFENKMEKEYTLLSKNNNVNDIEKINDKVISLQNFQNKYPENPYKGEIAKQIDSLNKIFITSKVEKYLGEGNLLEAEVAYDNFISKNPDYAQNIDMLYLKQKIMQQNMDKLMQIFAKVDVLVKNKQFSQAKNMLQEAKNGQRSTNLILIKDKTSIIEKEESRYLWSSLSQKAAAETYSFLRNRQYSNAESMIRKLRLEYPQEDIRKNLEKWRQYIETSEGIWVNFNKGLKKLSNKKQLYAFDIKFDTKRANTKILKYSTDQEKIRFDINRTFSFDVLSYDSIEKIIATQQNYKPYEKLLFLSMWKARFSIKIIDFDTEERKFQREILALYIIEHCRYSVRKKNIYDIIDSLKNINILKDTEAYSAQKEVLAKQVLSLSSSMQNDEKSALRKYIVAYLPDTQVAQSIKE